MTTLASRSVGMRCTLCLWLCKRTCLGRVCVADGRAAPCTTSPHPPVSHALASSHQERRACQGTAFRRSATPLTMAAWSRPLTAALLTQLHGVPADANLRLRGALVAELRLLLCRRPHSLRCEAPDSKLSLMGAGLQPRSLEEMAGSTTCKTRSRSLRVDYSLSVAAAVCVRFAPLCSPCQHTPCVPIRASRPARTVRG